MDARNDCVDLAKPRGMAVAQHAAQISAANGEPVSSCPYRNAAWLKSYERTKQMSLRLE